jgi:hypothetical protein
MKASGIFLLFVVHHDAKKLVRRFHRFLPPLEVNNSGAGEKRLEAGGEEEAAFGCPARADSIGCHAQAGVGMREEAREKGKVARCVAAMRIFFILHSSA